MAHIATLCCGIPPRVPMQLLVGQAPRPRYASGCQKKGVEGFGFGVKGSGFGGGGRVQGGLGSRILESKGYRI